MGGAGAGRGGGGVEDGEGGGLGRLVLPPVRHARRQIGVAGDGGFESRRLSVVVVLGSGNGW